MSNIISIFPLELEIHSQDWFLKLSRQTNWIFLLIEQYILEQIA